MKRVLGVVLWLGLASLLPGSLLAQTQVISRGRTSTTNATSTPLGSGATFTGTWEDTRDYSLVTVSVFANQNSASGGWKLQWSSDATNLDLEDTYTVTASVGQSQTSSTKARYFRVSYVNSASAQATFRLGTTFRQPGAPPAPTSVTTGGLSDTQLRATPVPVSGTVTATPTGTQAVSAAALPLPAGAATSALQTQPGVDIGDVTVNNAAGASAVNVQDGGNSLTVDGTVAVTSAGLTNLDVALSTRLKPADTLTGVTTVAAVTAITNALPAGNNNIGDVDVVTLPSVAQATAANLNAQVQGAGASGAAKAGNPVQQGGVFNTTQPTVTNGQGVEAQMTARGAQIVAPGVDGFAVTGTVTTTPPSNASTNVAQMAGTAVSMNTGVRDAGTQRVTVATNDAVPVTDNGGSLTVDGTVTTAPPANASTNLTQVVGTAVDVNSGTKSAGTIRVVLATDQPQLTNKLLVTPDSVALPANQSVNTAQFGGTNVSTGTGAGGAGIPRMTVSNDSNVIITPPTLTKGTQGTTGLSVQELKDAGRTAISFYANNVAAGTTTTETLITLTQSKGTGATSAAASYTITSGKTLRLTAIQVAARGHATATIQSTIFNLRMNTAGACIVSSTPILLAAQAATPAVASAWDRVIIPLNDGYEIAGNGTIAICVSAAATYVTNAPTWSVNLIGYEY